MRPVREITSEEERLRIVEHPGRYFASLKRDPVEPEPVGTIVVKAFRITGYDRDCDGSLMARLEAIDKDGEATGWEPTNIGVGPDNALVVTDAEWKALFGS